MMSLINSADLLIIILRRPTVVFYRGLTVWLTFLFLLTCCIFTFLLFSPLNKHLLKVGNVRIHHAKFIHGLDAMILAPSEWRSSFTMIRSIDKSRRQLSRFISTNAINLMWTSTPLLLLLIRRSAYNDCSCVRTPDILVASGQRVLRQQRYRLYQRRSINFSIDMWPFLLL